MIDTAKFKELYISETEDELSVLNGKMLELEKLISGKDVNDAARQEVLNELMRAAHTIKGSSATMGYSKMAYLAHVMEDVFDAGRHGSFDIRPEITNDLFLAIDSLEDSLVMIKNSGSEKNTDRVAEKIKKLAGVKTAGIGKSSRSEKTTAGSEISDASVAEVVQKEEKIKQNDLDKVLTANDEDGIIKDVDGAHENVKKVEYIKVPIKRLDALVDLAEELVTDRMKLEQVSSKSQSAELKEVTGHISSLIQSMQYDLMQSRLVPVGQIFERFPRMVRDLAQRQKKDINFVVSGEDLELDRSIVDKLGEPLVHLIRNAIDHGIKERGNILLNAVRDKDYALITVENDDCRIDVGKVKDAAIRRGIINLKEAESLRESQLIDLIFNPNLSTKEQVTEISGRGVGLSVVKSFVETLGGHITVNNLDAGVRFTLALPLTLAIINSLLAQVGEEYYAFPFSNVERSVIIRPEHIRKMADHHVAVVDGINVPLINLRHIFGLCRQSAQKTKASSKRSGGSLTDTNNDIAYSGSVIAIMIRRGEELVGVMVDKIISEQEVTVKPLPPVLRDTRGFSGSTILGDGKVILILDAVNLLERAKTI